NIMLRRDGYVKVLDFGIAKLSEKPSQPADPEVGTTTVLQTHPGLLVGTVHYMSPEQIRGQPTDARSDIWSLGVVLYEMLSGVPPFSGTTASDCIASVLKTEPPPLTSVTPDVAPELQSLVQKVLSKNRDERYQTAAEVLADLRSVKGKLEQQASAPKIAPAWVWTAAASAIVLVGIATLFFIRYRSLPVAATAPNSSSTVSTESSAPVNIPEKSIAVLPFENRSHDADNAYFADAIQDEILTRLSKIADL